MNHPSVRFLLFLAVTFFTFSFASASTLAQENIALNKPVTASSEQTSVLISQNVNDGRMDSRWSTLFSDDQWIAIDLGSPHHINEVKLHWQNSYAREYEIQVSNDGEAWTTVFSESDGDGSLDVVALNHVGRFIRMYGIKRFTRYGFSLWEFEVFGAPNTTNVALNSHVTASSQQTTLLTPSMAVDGSLDSRWSTAFSDNQWLMLDLGSNHQINRVKLHWQNSYGREYKLQTSADGSTWTTIFHETDGNGGIDDIDVSGAGRYFRMLGIKRFTRYGFSLWEMEVYGYPRSNAAASSSSVSSSSVSSMSSVSSSSSSSSVSSSSSNSAGDSHAPTAPGVVTATGFESRIEISWAPSIDNLSVTGYQVYRNSIKVADLSGAVSRYIDTNAVRDVTYSYSIRARDAAANWSTMSSIVSAKLTSAEELTLTWSNPTSRENGAYLELDEIGGYEIRYKKVTDSVYTTIIIINNNDTNSYSMNQPSDSYEYEIAAFDTTGLYSNFVSIQPE